jgi:copper(I)-binding protein
MKGAQIKFLGAIRGTALALSNFSQKEAVETLDPQLEGTCPGMSHRYAYLTVRNQAADTIHLVFPC